MPRGKALTLTTQMALGLFFIQRYRFLTIDQYARAAELTARPPPTSCGFSSACGAEALVVEVRPAPEGGLGQPELL